MALNKSRFARSRCCVCALAITATGFITTAHAQSSEEAVKFDLPPQNLEQALKSFSVSADKQLMFATDLAEGKTVAGLSGEMKPMQALDELLDGTGLVYETTSSNVILVKVTDGDQGGDSDSKNLNPTPVMMAQSQTTQAQTQTSRSDEGGTSIVTGKVTDARTGANLKGAKIMIEETGQWTSTNDLGEFRFVNVPTGSVTLTVSFLGYAVQSTVVGVRSEGTMQNFALRGGSEIEEIVVFGQRSARALALNQERAAENFSTVLSADLLGSFGGLTVSESLRRAPGISFQQSAVTGEGTNVIIRGLEPDLNMVTLNGLRIPEGTGEGRAADLSNILTESISKITINKSLLPSHDSAGTGGLIEIETRGPLDRPRRHASFSVQGGRTDGDFWEDSAASGTVSGKFGRTENFGVSASAQYAKRSLETLSYTVLTDFFGQYLPIAEDGSLVTFPTLVDPFQSFPYEPGVDEVYPSAVGNNFNSVETEDFSVTIAGQLQVSDHTNLRFDYTRAREETDSYRANAEFRPFAGYFPFPIDELNGEERYALVWEDAGAIFGVPGLVSDGRQIYTYEKGTERNTDIYSLRGESTLGPWSIDYSAGFSRGETKEPFDASLRFGRTFNSIFFGQLDPAFLLPEAANNLIDGRVVHAYSPLVGSGYPLPLFNQDGFEFFNDAGNYQLLVGNIFSGRGENDRSTGSVGLRYDFNSSPFKYLEAGVFFERAKFSNVDSTTLSIDSTRPPLSAVGLEMTENRFAQIGINTGFNVVPQADIVRFLNNVESIASSNPDITTIGGSLSDPLRANAFTEEENFAGYLQGRVDLGRLEIVGGVRLDRVEILARVPRAPVLIDEDGVRDQDIVDRFTVLVDQRATQSKLLPRILFNFRKSENTTFRAGYFRSVARPQIRNLSSNKIIFLDLRPTYGPAQNQPFISVTEGNPDLNPAETDNFDLSVEYFDNNIGAIKLALFYKKIENLLESNVSFGSDSLDGADLPDDPGFNNLPSDIFIRVTRPENAKSSAKIWGIETSIEKQFTSLPGWMGGLGVFANYTYSDSARDLLFSISGIDEEVVIPDFDFTQQPEHSGTVAITYNMHNLDASIAYTEQARRLNSFRPNNLSIYDESDSTLDFRAEYWVPWRESDFRIWFEASDLLKGRSSPDVLRTLGGTGQTRRIYTGGNFFGGRVFRLGISTTF